MSTPTPPEPERGECRWWQRHDWSKWYEIPVVAMKGGIAEIKGYGQERKCFRCDYREKDYS